jgi:hypothetical protein
MSHKSLSLFVKREADGDVLHAAHDCRPGDIVFRFDALTWRTGPDPGAIQHPSGGYIFHPLIAMARHSCEPNSRASFEGRCMVAIGRIAAGEAITFDRRAVAGRSTVLSECRCGAARCRGAAD